MLPYLEGDTSPAAKKQNRATTFRMTAVDGDQQALLQGKGGGHHRVPGAPVPPTGTERSDHRRPTRGTYRHHSAEQLALQLFLIALLRKTHLINATMSAQMKYVRLGNSGLKVSRISIPSYRVVWLIVPSSRVHVLRQRHMAEMGFKRR